MRKGRLGKNITIYLLIFAIVLGFFWFFNTDSDQGMKQIKTSTMISHLKANEVESINVTETKLTAKLKEGDTVLVGSVCSKEGSIAPCCCYPI